MTIPTPLKHQHRWAHEISGTKKRFMLEWEPGVGKTLGMLFMMEQRELPTLIVTCKTLVYAAWANDARKLRRNVMIYRGTPQQRKSMMRVIAESTGRNPRFTVATNFDTARIDLAALLTAGFRRLIIDESTFIKTPAFRKTNGTIVGPKITYGMWQLADRMDEVYLLTGDADPNGPEEYFAQLRALSNHPRGPAGIPHGTHEPNFWTWSSHWLHCTTRKVPVFDKRTGRKTMKDVPVSYRVRPDRAQQFQQMLAEWTWPLRASDCIDIPEARDVVVPIECCPRVFEMMLKLNSGSEIVGPKGQPFKVPIEHKGMKLRQLSGGFMNTPDGWMRVSTAKTEALCELATSLGNEPLLVWTQFHVEADDVLEVMSKLGRRAAICDGRQADNAATIARFVAGELDTLVCHPQSVGHGATLVRCGDRPCRYDVWFQIDWDAELWFQARERIHRLGQTEKTTHFILQMQKTVDARILRAVQERRHVGEVTNDAVRALSELVNSTDDDPVD